MHDTAPLFDALRRFVERVQAPFYSPRRHRPAQALRTAGNPISAFGPELRFS